MAKSRKRKPVRRGYKLVRYRFLRVLRCVGRSCPEECREVIDFTVSETRHLLDHGEGGIGLDILLSNLVEISFPVPPDLLEELRWLTTRFALEPRSASLLEHLSESSAATDAGSN